MSLEFLRRAQREFDRYLVRHNVNLIPRHDVSEGEDGDSDGRQGKANTAMGIQRAGNLEFRAQLKLWQHVVRSFLYMAQFAVGYIVMLLAMYYNGTPLQLFLVQPGSGFPSPLSSTGRSALTD